MRLQAVAAALMLSLATLPATAASATKSYTYFSIGGRTVAEIEDQLTTRGPKISGSDRRHFGATSMQFDTKMHYQPKGNRCVVAKVTVKLKATVILPRWQQAGATRDLRMVWETLIADIRRHEDVHVAVAKRYADRLERTLKGLASEDDCPTLKARGREATDAVLNEHEREQARFDAAEARSFQQRFLALLEKRTKSPRARR